jgi:D-alanyl-D-alanine carboxypeptidase
MVRKQKGQAKPGHRALPAGVFAAVLLAVGAAAAGPANPVPAKRPSSATPAAYQLPGSLTDELREDLQAYLRTRAEAEHASATGLSVSLPGQTSSIDVSAGTMRLDSSRPVAADGIWQIGSNTKAFTSVMLLQLEAEHRLSIEDRLGQWLPQYPQWRDVAIKRLLNMTSGIATYDAQPAFLTDYATKPHTDFSKERLVRYASKAPATSGYSYSNTNYVLAEMIIEKATGDSYAHQLHNRIIRPLRLRDMFYHAHLYPRSVTSREPAGYFYIDQIPELSGLLGRDVSGDTLSWARGAGGIVATTRDMTIWERALYGGRLLPPKQQTELTSLVSQQTGEPIAQTSRQDPRGFGLGITQMTTSKFGTVWTYEGATFGFRALHVYFPQSGVVMAMTVNSQPAEDQISTLALSVYDSLVSHGMIVGFRHPRQRSRPVPGTDDPSAEHKVGPGGNGPHVAVAPARADPPTDR